MVARLRFEPTARWDPGFRRMPGKNIVDYAGVGTSGALTWLEPPTAHSQLRELGVNPDSPVRDSRIREAGARSVNMCQLLGWQGRNVFCPAFERLAHLGRVPRAVIYTSNARPVAANVV